MNKSSLIHNFKLRIRQILSDLAYEFFKTCLRGGVPLFFRVRLKGKENAPREGGPLMVISNHLSEWDPPFMGCFLPWQVHWLAKVELFELLGGWMSGFFRMLHCVPLERGKADLAAFKQCIRLARNKRPVAVFVEGGIRTDETSILGSQPEIKEGAAIIALAAGCPILPIVLNGTMAAYDWKNWLFLRRPLIEIRVGPVFRLEGKDRHEATREMLRHLLDLKTGLVQQSPS